MSLRTMSLRPLGDYLGALRRNTPLVHCMTNYVAMNSTANLLLATGASPAMLHAQEEVAEFTALAGALSINIGTISAPWAEAIRTAVTTANQHATPWVLDPVAVGATQFRQTLCADLLALRPTVIRANPSEVMALAGMASKGRGVDATASLQDAADAAIALASTQACVVAMTGEQDLITDGHRHITLSGGHPLMPRVTTLGCALSALVAGFVAASPDDPLGASTAALACFAVAGAEAGQQAQGPGSFQVALLDALYQLTPESLTQHADWEFYHGA